MGKAGWLGFLTMLRSPSLSSSSIRGLWVPRAGGVDTPHPVATEVAEPSVEAKAFALSLPLFAVG